MTFMNWKVAGNPGDTIVIKLDVPAFVRLLDPLNFENYRRGIKYQGDGGKTDQLEVVFSLPYKGTFYAVVDLGGAAGLVKATCTVRRV